MLGKSFHEIWCNRNLEVYKLDFLFCSFQILLTWTELLWNVYAVKLSIDFVCPCGISYSQLFLKFGEFVYHNMSILWHWRDLWYITHIRDSFPLAYIVWLSRAQGHRPSHNIAFVFHINMHVATREWEWNLLTATTKQYVLQSYSTMVMKMWKATLPLLLIATLFDYVELQVRSCNRLK